MKTKMLLGLALLATLGMTSCKKDKDEEATSVKIGNKDYAIVTIGDKTWTAENYSGEGGLYYDNDAANANLGKLYTIVEARAVVVPQGWRLPTLADYKKLFTDQGVTFVDDAEDEDGYSDETSWAGLQKVMATSGWEFAQGTNTTKFNALPTGEGYGDDDFGGKGNLTVFWTSSKNSENVPYYIGIYRDDSPPYDVYYSASSGGYRFPLRFVKDN